VLIYSLQSTLDHTERRGTCSRTHSSRYIHLLFFLEYKITVLTACPDHYRVVGINRYQLPGRIRCTIHPLQLTAEDRQALRTSEDHVPSPRIHPRSSTSLRLDLDQEILYVRFCVSLLTYCSINSRHCQLLGGGLCLVAISDQTNDVQVYLEPLADINTSIYRRHSKKLLRRERIGHHPLIAFDETKRMLAFLPRSVVGCILYLAFIHN
jgi:hypothetical protein